MARSALDPEIRPDIPVGELVLFGLAALPEPLVFLGSVPGNKIDQNMNAPLVCCLEQLIQIFVGTVAGSDLFVIPDIISRIFER